MYILGKSYIMRFWITVIVLTASSIIWMLGLSQSPLFESEIYKERMSTERNSKYAPGDPKEKILAEAYWRRYPDVEKSAYFGRQGPLGLHGAREHFKQHGKREGRILAPILIPDDLINEQHLAEAYWQRYPDVERNDIWGRDGSLGILGPRDHYQYLGRFSGHKWGVDPE